MEELKSINENNVLLPENCLKETFTIMVEDNIDRLEETLSGEYFMLHLLLFLSLILFLMSIRGSRS